MDLDDGDPWLEEEEDDDSIKDDLENELYSILHFADFSQGVPEEVKEKYHVEWDDKGGVQISLKRMASEIVSDDWGNGNGSSDKGLIISHDVLEKEEPNNDSSTMRQNKDYWKQDSPVAVKDDDMSKSNQVKRRDVSTAPVPLITISDDDGDDDDDLIVNIDPPPVVIDLGGSESDDEGVFDTTNSLNWKNNVCPSTWSKSMRRFYNRPSKRLKTLDHIKLIKELKASTANWRVKQADVVPTSRSKPKCPICKMRGHLASECVKREKNCYMCGYPGHLASRCPSTMCLNCGSPSDAYRVTCESCVNEASMFCKFCHKRGHIDSMCTEVWRRFHSLPNNEIRQNVNLLKSGKQEGRRACCNCAKEGHVYEECKELFSSSSKFMRNGSNQRGDDESRIVDGKEHRVFVPQSIDTNSEVYNRLIGTYEGRGLIIRKIPSRQGTMFKVSGMKKQVKDFRRELNSLRPYTPNRGGWGGHHSHIGGPTQGFQQGPKGPWGSLKPWQGRGKKWQKRQGGSKNRHFFV